jgi:hypothetical protein
MVYVCAIPQTVPGARRIIPPTDWKGFRSELATQLPVETRLEFIEPTPNRSSGWILWVRPRANAALSEDALHALYHDVSNRIDVFLDAHSSRDSAEAA